MAAPNKSDLETMDSGYDGVPFVNVAGKDSIDTTTLDFGYGGVPFYGVVAGAAPPAPDKRRLVFILT